MSLRLLIYGGLLSDVTPKFGYSVRPIMLLQEAMHICGVSWGAMRKRLERDKR